MDKKFCIKRFLGKDECGDVFIYDYPPNIKGESPNRCLVSNGTEEKIYDAEVGFTEVGKLMPITIEMFEGIKPLETKTITLIAQC